MIYTNSNSSFPSQVVPDEEKQSYEYGALVGRAIENEWFRGDRVGGGVGNRWGSNWQNFHRLRLYARGEQPVQKYKDELSINGDLSYLNLDWKPIPIIPKFVDIVVNGLSNKSYEIKAYAQDPEATKQKTDYAAGILRDMMAKDLLDEIQSKLGANLYNTLDPSKLPETTEELEIHLQLDYKQSIEIAEEEVINQILDTNKYDLVSKRLNYDLTVLGIAAAKTNWNPANGITIDWVDPATLVYSYTEDPNFEDIYYVGEVKSISLEELKKQFPHLSDADLKEIEKYPGDVNYTRNYYGQDQSDNTVQVLYFEYKTYSNQVFKIKQTEQGLEKALEKPDTFNPPTSDNFERVSRTIEVLYSGAKILGFEKMLEWKLAENMTRPYADTTKVEMNYAICAPRMYKGKIESLVSRITTFADMIQLTHLKLQQVLSRMVPDGVFVDVDGLAEVDLGNGTNYNAAEALNMYFQTGSIVGRSQSQDGGMNPGKVPIQELQTSSGNAKISSLISTYQYYLQMIRDVTGLNEARDGSSPDRDALVGLQKMAAANSNTSTRHIKDASLFLTLRVCENVSLRISDSLNFPLTRQSLIESISISNVETLKEIVNLNLHDFGIFLELEPEDEEKAQLEQNIQMSLQTGSIDLEDAIDLREIKNLKLANQSLKYKRKKKQEQVQANQQANIQAQAQANAQASEAAALAEVQKQQALAQTEIQILQSKSQFEIQRMQQELLIEKQKMAQKFEYDMQLAQVQLGIAQQKQTQAEDRKDQRTKIQATQQSELIDQRKNNSMPKDFESSYDDLSGFGM
ncbi:MAG: hypothetical protein ACOVJ5_01925 [Gloeomargaritales cyanobacterium]|jgi:hypothetical protein